MEHARFGVCKFCSAAIAAKPVGRLPSVCSGCAGVVRIPIEEKPCAACRVCKPATEFSKDSRRRNGLSSYCKPCANARTRAQYAANPGKKLAKNHEWQKRNQERETARHRAWREANPELARAKSRAWYEKNKERYTEVTKAWASANKDKKAAYVARRRAAKLLRTPKWLNDTQRLEMEQQYTLAKIHEWVTGMKWEVDHIIPLQGKTVSGLNVPWNLQVIPRSTNRQKAYKYEQE